MGASAWSYFTEYDTDVVRAFESLRDRVFREGDYIGPGGHRAFSNEVRAEPRPDTIGEVLAARGEPGTHSILDIVFFALEQGAPRPTRVITVGDGTYELLVDEGGECRMATQDEIRETIGVDRPSRTDLEARGNFLELLGRGEALCVAVWEEGRPSALYFQGRSGD